MKKKIFISLVSFLILAGSVLSVPAVLAATSDDPAYLNCLCEAACSKAGWDCSVVGCAYQPQPVDASPECLDTGKGACICEGYGCGRAPIEYSGTAATQCLANATTTSCQTLYDAYNKNRTEYINEWNVRQGLTDYGYKVANIYNNNVLKLTTAFVLSRLSPPNSSGTDFLIDRVQDKVFDKVFSALQSAETKADIQVNLLKMLTLTDAEMKRINTVQPIRVNKLKDLLSRMKTNNCSTTNTSVDLFIPGLKTNAPGTYEFKDINPDNTRGVAVTYLSENKIVKGYDDGTFKPANPINRAEFTKILMESAFPGESFSDSGCFPDASAGSWYAGYVCAAKKKGIIGGYPDGSFKPANTINAAEMLKILLNTLKPASVPAAKTGEPWFQRFWTAATDLGILPNDVTTPGDSITRGQMAETTFGVIGAPVAEKDIWNYDYTPAESTMVDVNSIAVDSSVQSTFEWDWTTGMTTDSTTPTTTTPTPVTPPPVTPTPVTPTGSANNTIANATKLNIAVTQQTVNGTLSTAGDLNYFNFLFGAPSVLTYGVDVTGVKQTSSATQTVNYKGTVVSSAGVEQPCMVNASSSTPVSLTTDNVSNNCYFPAGSWNIKIWGNGSTDYSATPYKVTFSQMNGAADAFEPNNTMATATSFAISASPQTVVNPNIWGRGDVDYYAFTLGAQSQLSMKLDVTTVKNALVPANTAYYDARLLDSSGNELNCNMSAGPFRLVHEKNDCIFPAGSYYMKVMGDSENEFSTNPYGLTLSATPTV